MYFYGEKNKSRWERGGQKKFKKGINIFSKKVLLRGGGPMLPRGGPNIFFCVLTRANCAPPLNKSLRTPLSLVSWILVHSVSIQSIGLPGLKCSSKSLALNQLTYTWYFETALSSSCMYQYLLLKAEQTEHKSNLLAFFSNSSSISATRVSNWFTFSL